MATPPRSAADWSFSPPEQAADRGARTGDDHGSGHDFLQGNSGRAGHRDRGADPVDTTHPNPARRGVGAPATVRKRSQGVPRAERTDHDEGHGRLSGSGAPVHRDRPRRHRRPRPRRGDGLLPGAVRHDRGARGDQRGAGRARGDGRGRRLRIVHPAAGPAERELHDRQVPRPLRARHPAAGLPGRPTSTRSGRCCGSAACACCTTPHAAAPPGPGSTSSTPRTRAGC